MAVFTTFLLVLLSLGTLVSGNATVGNVIGNETASSELVKHWMDSFSDLQERNFTEPESKIAMKMQARYLSNIGRHSNSTTVKGFLKSMGAFTKEFNDTVSNISSEIGDGVLELGQDVGESAKRIGTDIGSSVASLGGTVVDTSKKIYDDIANPGDRDFFGTAIEVTKDAAKGLKDAASVVTSSVSRITEDIEKSGSRILDTILGRFGRIESVLHSAVTHLTNGYHDVKDSVNTLDQRVRRSSDNNRIRELPHDGRSTIQEQMPRLYNDLGEYIGHKTPEYYNDNGRQSQQRWQYYNDNGRSLSLQRRELSDLQQAQVYSWFQKWQQQEQQQQQQQQQQQEQQQYQSSQHQLQLKSQMKSKYDFQDWQQRQRQYNPKGKYKPHGYEANTIDDSPYRHSLQTRGAGSMFAAHQQQPPPPPPPPPAQQPQQAQPVININTYQIRNNQALMTVETARVNGVDVEVSYRAFLTHIANFQNEFPRWWNAAAQLKYYSWRDQDEGDERGHMLAHSLGGPSVAWNLQPQAHSVNQGNAHPPNWIHLENLVRAWLNDDAGHAVWWRLDIDYFNNQDPRPNLFRIHVTFFAPDQFGVDEIVHDEFLSCENLNNVPCINDAW
jgi:DNA/RNA non-specific endonuclease